MNDFSDFWQHCPTPAAAGFFYNSTGTSDSTYSNPMVPQPRHLFAAAAAAFDPNSQIAANSDSFSTPNSNSFSSNPFQHSFSNSFFGANFTLPTTSSRFSFPITNNNNRRKMQNLSQTALNIENSTGFVNF